MDDMIERMARELARCDGIRKLGAVSDERLGWWVHAQWRSYVADARAAWAVTHEPTNVMIERAWEMADGKDIGLTVEELVEFWQTMHEAAAQTQKQPDHPKAGRRKG